MSMEGKDACDNCHNELLPGASIVFTPNEASATEKHLCMSCFENLNKQSA